PNAVSPAGQESKRHRMTPFDGNAYSEAEAVAEFDRLFPHGFGGPDVRQEIAPEGWEHSPLAAVFHPSAEQVYDERPRFHRTLAALRRKDAPPPPRPEPTREDVARDYRPAPVEAAREIPELVGQCLWDIFSDNHEVVGPDGRLLDLGSFRASRR